MSIDKSESIKELASALAKTQGKLKPAVKDSVNPHFKSKYADLGAVWEACRDALTSNGLSVVQMPIDSEAGRVGLMTILMHTSGEYITSSISTRLTQDTAQGVGSALTYLRRYALAAFVGIVADEDDDGNAASSSPQHRQQTPARTPAQNGASYKPQANGSSERPLVKQLRELVTQARTLGLAVPSFPRPKEMTDEQLYDAVRQMEAAIQEPGDPSIESEYDAIDAAAK